MSLYCMRCINQTKIHVPNIALTNANIALPHIVASGASISARRIPNCADEIVAPVVGETNLFMHNCCIISPATLIPIPVHRIARSLGSLDITKTSIACESIKKFFILISIAPIKSDTTDKTRRSIARVNVIIFFLINVFIIITIMLLFRLLLLEYTNLFSLKNSIY